MNNGLTENEELVRKVLRKCVFIAINGFGNLFAFKEIVGVLSEMTKILKNEGII